MSENPKRPWYSFRAPILFWVLLLLLIVAVADFMYALAHALAAGPDN